MEKFSATAFYLVAQNITLFRDTLARGKREGIPSPTADGCALLRHIAEDVAKECKKIDLHCSARFAARLAKFISQEADFVIVQDRMTELSASIRDEMEAHAFFWVPKHRSDWYGRDAKSILGKNCYKRFGSVITDTEEAAKCYAVGRYTACAFHLMRVTEAGVFALGAAIGHPIKGGSWARVLKRFNEQLAMKQKPSHWMGRFKKLGTIGALLHAVEHGWRNRIAHLDAHYDEDRAKHLLVVIPAFMKDLADTMDEDGKWV